MKLLLSVIAATFTLAWLIPDEAAAQNRGYRGKGGKKVYTRTYRRPPSIADNGLCQRDTGTATSNLNFRNKCDSEEFWARTLRGRR